MAVYPGGDLEHPAMRDARCRSSSAFRVARTMDSIPAQTSLIPFSACESGCSMLAAATAVT
jgi:hypothetical protein